MIAAGSSTGLGGTKEYTYLKVRGLYLSFRYQLQKNKASLKLCSGAVGSAEERHALFDLLPINCKVVVGCAWRGMKEPTTYKVREIPRHELVVNWRASDCGPCQGIPNIGIVERRILELIAPGL